MKRVCILLLIIGISCNNADKENQEPKAFKDNEELKTLYTEDQSERSSGNIDWSIVSVNDSIREARVFELLDSNLVRTSVDYSNAAMIFQHGSDTIASGMAVKMMYKAIALDKTIDKWLLAATIDRDLMRRNKPQIYGTQYTKIDDDQWGIYNIDTTIISDEERKEYGVSTLSEQKMRVARRNKKTLSDLYANGIGIDEIIDFYKSENKINTKYDLSESGINSFGYQLMAEGKDEDALKIFKLNSELYPNGANTYDSYGECLLKMGLKKESIKAYNKSLELDPKNTNAKKIVEKLNNNLL